MNFLQKFKVNIRKGVCVTSFPAIHSYDGSVSSLLYWYGLRFILGEDSRPNKWFMKFTKGVEKIRDRFYDRYYKNPDTGTGGESGGSRDPA